MADYIGTNFYIRPTYMVALPEYSGANPGRSEAQRKAEKNLDENEAKGILSRKSEKKLMNAVNWLVVSAKPKNLYSKKHKKYFHFKINFITLTFPLSTETMVSEKQAKKCLHAFLSYSRKYFYLRNYVWKFEKTAKGQLHVHLTTDTYIHYKRLRDCWNGILSRELLMEHYRDQHGNYDANSTDIHAVHKVKDVAAYIAKYMAKSQDAMSDFKGRIWASNYELSDVNRCTATVYRGDDTSKLRVLYGKDCEWKKILGPADKFNQQKEIGEIFFMNEKLWQKLQNSILKETYDSHRFHIRNNTENLPEEYWRACIDEFFDKHSSYAKPLIPVQNESLGYNPPAKAVRASAGRQTEVCFA